ncbi:MAG: tyrosine-type recombinase/integrase [Endozoicomonas sp.]|uniref:tyrosine-type recombinase/integrase n=1 Tax=Endozoicomonas sp. TaxID=1892382 RepID=UPI003D9BB848
MKFFTTYFTASEEKKLLATIKQQSADIYAERDYWWMVLARHTAVRVCVLSGLTVGDAQQAISRERLLIRPQINKRQKEQELFGKKIIIEALRNLVRIHKKMARPEDFANLTFEQRPLILSRKHKAMSVRSFQDRMSLWCEKAGLEAGSPHWWRHTWAKRQIKASDDVARTLMKVQVWLGHEDPKTTAIYTQPDKEEMTDFGRYAV